MSLFKSNMPVAISAMVIFLVGCGVATSPNSASKVAKISPPAVINNEPKVLTTLETSAAKTAWKAEQPLPVDVFHEFPSEPDGQSAKITLSNGLEAILILKDADPNIGAASLYFSGYPLTGDAHLPNFPEYEVRSIFPGDEKWFQKLAIVALGPAEIYVEDAGGHESMPGHYLIRGSQLINLVDVLKWQLADQFANEQFPQIGIQFYPSYLRVEEEKYCCDITYDVNQPEREKYRKVFYLDRKTLEIIKEEKVAR